jgi:hypothetical protein
MTLIQTLLKPDREELDIKERLVVIFAANALQVGEFQLLQLAYREWFDKDLPEALVARLFSAYMLKNDVPHWARHYARHIVELDALGTLDDLEPSYHRYDVEYRTSVPKGLQRFCLAVSLVVLSIGGSIWVANKLVDSSASVLPPYFNERELRAPSTNLMWGRADNVEHPGAGAVDDDGMD